VPFEWILSVYKFCDKSKYKSATVGDSFILNVSMLDVDYPFRPFLFPEKDDLNEKNSVFL